MASIDKNTALLVGHKYGATEVCFTALLILLRVCEKKHAYILHTVEIFVSLPLNCLNTNIVLLELECKPCIRVEVFCRNQVFAEDMRIKAGGSHAVVKVVDVEKVHL